MEWLYKLFPFLRPEPAKMYTVTRVAPFVNTARERGAVVTLTSVDDPSDQYVNVCWELHHTGGVKPLPHVNARAYRRRLDYGLPALWYIEIGDKWWNFPVQVPSGYPAKAVR